MNSWRDKNHHQAGLTFLRTTSQKILFILVMFMLTSLLLLAMSYLQADVLNSVRSYVRAEGLWAKAQKDAYFYLHDYAETGSPAAYQEFRKALTVPLGDKQARLALQSQPVDYAQARAGFLLAQNEPEDIDGMMRFFVNFQNVYYMHEAIRIWTEADALITELEQHGETIHAAMAYPQRVNWNVFHKRLYEINQQLTQLELDFSLILSEGARWVKNVTMIANALLLVLALALVVWIAQKIIRGIIETEHKLKISENRFRILSESGTLGIAVWSTNGLVLDANQTMLDMLGLKHQELLSKSINWRDLTPEHCVLRDNMALNELARTGKATPYEKELYHRDGHTVPIYVGSAIIDAARGEGISYVIDQTQSKTHENQLRLSAAVFDSSSEGILITDKTLNIINVNKSFCSMLGYRKEEVLGQKPAMFSSQLMQEDFYENLWRELRDSGHYRGDIIDRRKDGKSIALEIHINEVRNDKQEISHYVAVFNDISERIENEARLRKMAHYDMLTGLTNRSLFNDRLEQAIKHTARTGNKVALMFLDLDKFKPINDLYGHAMGDRLLQEIARRLQDNIREQDTAARIGGDEFVLLLEDISRHEDISKIAHKLIEAIGMPCQLDDLTLEVGCSIGIALYPDNGTTPDALIRSGDIAMYAAKANGRNTFFFFSPELANKP